MGNTFYFEWEVSLMEYLQSIFSGPLAVKIFSFFSMFGEKTVAIAILGFLYFGYNKELGKYLGTNLCVAITFNPFLKNIFLRRRPYFDNPSIKILKPVDKSADIYDIVAQGYSFPSGHSSCAAAIFGSIAVKAKRNWLRVICIVIPILVGISRFVLGAHYPTDVFVGWALGILTVFLVPVLQKIIKKTYILYLIFLLLGLPGFFFCTSSDFYTGYGVMIGIFAAILFENRFVNFENTKSIIRCIIRTAGGGVLYLGLNALLKLPFSEEFLEVGNFPSFFVRTARYAIVVFVLCGLYPMIFKYTKKIGKK